jgi:predicted HTH transcriptional regulator
MAARCEVSHEENRQCELKEVKGAYAVSAIANAADEYVVAFLNAARAEEGSIFWGVRDVDLKITGVNLSDRDCNSLRCLLTDKLHQITPPLAPTAYTVDLHPISDGENNIPNLYLVEVRVPSMQRSILFATGGGEVFIKTDAGKRKLSPMAIQLELARRLKVDLPL